MNVNAGDFVTVTIPTGRSYRCYVAKLNESLVHGNNGSYIATDLHLKVSNIDMQPSLRHRVAGVQQLLRKIKGPVSRAVANGMNKAAVLAAVGQLVDNLAPDLQDKDS